MKIGKMVKFLRRENNMTQEVLAERLNISVSAVSQWEMEKTMPDISMLPLLMEIFDVTADTLLGVNDQGVDDKVKAVIEQADDCHSRFEYDKELAIMHQLYEEYPNRLDVMTNYAFTLFGIAYNSNSEEQADECIKICKRILDRSLDDKQRFRALYYLSHCYGMKDDKESALYYIDKLPNTPHFCGDWLKEKLGILSEEERMKCYQQNAETFLWLLRESMFDIADPNYKNSTCTFSIAQRVEILEQIIAITRLIYGDKLCDKNSDMYAYHRIIGALWLLGNEQEKALDYLEMAYEYAAQFAVSYNKGDCYTSLAFYGWEACPQSDWSGGETSLLKNLCIRFEEQDRYRVLDNHPRFIELKKKLENSIDKNGIV